MKKIILGLTLLLTAFVNAQTYTHNSKVRVKTTDTSNSSDNIITIDANGLLNRSSFIISNVARLDQSQTFTAANTFSGMVSIINGAPVLRIRDVNSTGDAQLGFISFRNQADTETGWVGYGSTNNSDINIQNNIGNVTVNGYLIYNTNNLNLPEGIQITGTRANSDLTVSLGDYDDTGNETKFEINDGNTDFNFFNGIVKSDMTNSNIDSAPDDVLTTKRWVEANVGTGIQQDEIEFNATEVTNGTSKIIVADPGDGKFVKILSVSVKYTHGTASFSGIANAQVVYAGTTTGISGGTWGQSQPIANFTSTTRQNINVNTNVVEGDSQNVSILFDSGITGGTGSSFKFYIDYIIKDD